MNSKLVLLLLNFVALLAVIAKVNPRSMFGDPTLAGNSKVGVLVLTEPQNPRNRALVLQLLATTATWPVQVFCPVGIQQTLVQHKMLLHYNKIGRLRFTLLAEEEQGLEFSQIVVRPSFWKQVIGEKALLLDSKSVLCSNSEAALDDYFEYDWVSAPWSQESPEPSGSVTLRSRKWMLKILSSTKPTLPEAVFFVKQLRARGANVANMTMASKFAVESIYTPRPIAVGHVLDHLEKSDVSTLFDECPESAILPPIP